ncbi:MAG: hypothetical protein JNM41_11185 [Flavipsychrobacter sp.]|nr:hypothetical protein [Flavipsychrobacter sp.]
MRTTAKVNGEMAAAARPEQQATANAETMESVKEAERVTRIAASVARWISLTETEKKAMKALFFRLLIKGKKTQKEAAAVCGISEVTAVKWVRDAGGKEVIARQREKATPSKHITVTELLLWIKTTGKYGGMYNELVKAALDYEQLNWKG